MNYRLTQSLKQMKTRIRIFLGILLFFSAQLHATSYTSVNNGPWNNPANWSPSGVPADDDEVTISHEITLTENMISWPKGVSLLTITSAGSLISQGTEGVQIDNDGFLTVSGYMDVYEIYFKGSAEVIINSGAEVIVQTNWSSQGENGGDLDPFIVSGNLTVLGTFEDDGSNITGTGTIYAGEWDLEGTFLFYGQYDPNNPPDPNTTLYGSTWEGNINNDWNLGDNWASQETPGMSDAVLIPSGISVYPVIFSGNNPECTELILEPATSVAIHPGGSLTVLSQLTNDGTIIINSNGSGTGSFIDGGLNDGAGNVQFHRFLSDESGIGTYYVHQVGAPVTGQVLGDFNLIPGRTYAYEFLPTASSWNNIWDPTILMPPMKGIILSTLNNTGHQTAIFEGQPVTGSQTVDLVPGTAGNVAFNLIGNPYPSAIDWEEIVPMNGIANYVYIWDPSVPEYKAYVLGTGGSLSCRYIQPGQAFFVGATQQATSLTFENSFRTHQNQPFLKEQAEDYLQVSLSGGNGTGSNTYIRLLDGATNAFDDGQEAEKWFSIYGSEANEIYTVSEDGIALQVAAFPKASNQPVSVPLSLRPASQGQYTLNFTGLDSFGSDMKLFLEDKMNAAQGWINLKDEPVYQFTASAGENESRFVVHIGRNLTSVEALTDRLNPLIYITSDGRDIIVHNTMDIAIDEISVLDLSGREVLSQGYTTGSLIRPPSDNQTGFYLVRVKTAQGIITGKVFLR